MYMLIRREGREEGEVGVRYSYFILILDTFTLISSLPQAAKRGKDIAGKLMGVGKRLGRRRQGKEKRKEDFQDVELNEDEDEGEGGEGEGDLKRKGKEKGEEENRGKSKFPHSHSLLSLSYSLLTSHFSLLTVPKISMTLRQK